jgi:ubiquinone/menaquinone biosynthesis C-methylase UbiE
MELDSSSGLERLYTQRFGGEAEPRSDLWSVLCQHYFQQWVPEGATVLDIAAGHCEFINNIAAARRIAIDLNPDLKNRAAEGVETIVGRSDDLVEIADSSMDVVFISNFFEHVTREVILGTLVEARRVLRPTGRLLIVQPNVRYCGKDYWQFFDHITPIDDRALSEALEATGYRIEKCLPRFLPYTTKSHLPTNQALVRLYLKVPLAWRVLGAQAFFVARPITADQHL